MLGGLSTYDNSCRVFLRRYQLLRPSPILKSATSTLLLLAVNLFFHPTGACKLSSSAFGYSNMAFVTERSQDGTITVGPKKEQDQSALVVICHGLGDSAEGKTVLYLALSSSCLVPSFYLFPFSAGFADVAEVRHL